MAPKSYNEILEDQQMILELIDQPDLDEDERQELVNFWMDLKSREAYKFDAIISVIRECDNCIDQVTKSWLNSVTMLSTGKRSVRMLLHH